MFQGRWGVLGVPTPRQESLGRLQDVLQIFEVRNGAETAKGAKAAPREFERSSWHQISVDEDSAKGWGALSK